MSAHLFALLVLLAAPARPAKVAPREPAADAGKSAPADAPRAASAPAAAVSLSVLTPAPRRHAPQNTACAACHTTSSWNETRFNHARTGFPLEGKHASTACKACHPVDFARSVPASCSGCHLDIHAGELGSRCEGCHDPNSWKSRFPADAHRFTGFPLVGRHAALPCGECHATEAAGRFSRQVSACVSCHQREVDRTAGTAIDHVQRGFSTNCQECHQAWTFRGARFPGHDACFILSSGGHVGLACRECHSDLSTPPTGTCRTGTSFCISCHAHPCAKSDPQHANFMGYGCTDQRCTSCHSEFR